MPSIALPSLATSIYDLMYMTKTTQDRQMLHPVQLFKTLSDETRLSIVMLLREAGELCVCDLCSGYQRAAAESLPPHGLTARGRAGHRPSRG